MIKLLILIKFLLMLLNLDPLITINTKNEPIILNNLFLSNFNNIQIGFYLFIDSIIDNVNILTFTDFNNFNIDIKILSNNNKILINNVNSNLTINNHTFIYLKAEVINFKINIKLKTNNLIDNFTFIYDKIYKNFNFNQVKIILGSNKDLMQFKFNGKISYFNYIINNNNKFEELKNYYSRVLIHHNFNNNASNSNYFFNEIENGFMGSINGNSKYIDKYDILIKENILSNRKVFIDTYFGNTESYITLSNDFIKYTSLFHKLSYSVYLTLKIVCSCFGNYSINYEFFFYKRENWTFSNKINRCYPNGYYNFEIKSSSGSIKSGSSFQVVYFKIILLKIWHTSDNNYKISYFYKTNKTSINDYLNINLTINENHLFSNSDKHYIGIFNFNDNIKISFRWYIYETLLILGTSFTELNNKIYADNKKFVLFCNDRRILIKNRANDTRTCENDSRTGIKYPIDYCILYKNSICFKCVDSYKLENNTCNIKNIIYNDEDNFKNFNLSFNSVNSTIKRNHDFTLNWGTEMKLYEFNCNLGIANEKFIDIKIKLNDNTFKYISERYNSSISNLNVYFKLYLNNTNKISFEKVDKAYRITYSCQIYTSKFITDTKNIITFEKCQYLINNNYITKITNFNMSECINKNNIPINYYLNNNTKIVWKCNKNCKRCDSFISCSECNEGYFLFNKICLKWEQENCEIFKISNKCLLCNDNFKTFLINNNIVNCFRNCSDGCKNCNSPVYNECLDCNEGFLYYSELKQCIRGTNCINNYIRLESNPKICIKNCKLNDSEGKCLSCNNLLYLNTTLNYCIECSWNNGYFKNNIIKDSENKETCEKCSDNCKTCINNKYNCTSCKDNKLLLIDQHVCTLKCPDGYFLKNILCINCNKNCLKCDSLNKNCIKCDQGLFIKRNICVSDCNNGYYLSNGKCLKCINNCKSCINNKFCLKCKNKFYLNEDNSTCDKCISSDSIELEGKCLKCSENCKSCINTVNNCTSCNQGMFLKNNDNEFICIEKCNKNYFFNINLNKCTNCSLCNYCFKNSKKNCDSCPKCNNKCKFKINLKENKIKIYNNKDLDITYNPEYKIKLSSNNLINTHSSKDNIEFIYKNKFKPPYLQLGLDDFLIKNSKNCIGLQKYKYILEIPKPLCLMRIKNNFIDKNKGFFIIIDYNFWFIDDFKIKIIIEIINREVEYKIINKTVKNHKTLLKIQIFPNYFKTKYNILFKVRKEFINQIQCTGVINYKYEINYKTSKFENDSNINMKQILKTKDFNIIKNAEIISKNLKNTSTGSSIAILILNLFNTGNIFLFLSIVQLVNILEFILLLPVNLGEITNTFIKYFKIDLDIDIHINKYLNIKNKMEILKFYENIFIFNPKLASAKWINISYIQLFVIIFIIIFLIKILILIIYFFVWKFNKIAKIKNSNTKIILTIKLIIFKLDILIFKIIESIKSKWLGILIVYLDHIYLFNLNFDNIKIISIIFIYYLIILYYLSQIILSVLYIKSNNKSIEQSNYYNEILQFNTFNIDRYTLFQIFNFIKELNFILIIFLLKFSNLHLILFIINQSIFIIYLYYLDARIDYTEIQKIRLEELINLTLIVSVFMNYYFGLVQFQFLFIISYIFLLGIIIINLLYKMIYGLYIFIKNKLNKKCLRNKNRVFYINVNVKS